MRDIKIKPDMDKPKALAKHFTPKDATSLQKKKLEQQKAAKEPESRDGVRYATDKTEHGMRNGTLLAADLSRRMVKRTCEKRQETAQNRSAETPLSAHANLPSEVVGESISANAVKPVRPEIGQATPTTAKIKTQTAPVQSVPDTPKNTKAAPQERGRQKAMQNAKAKKQVQQHLAGKRTAENPIPDKPNGRGRAIPAAKRYSASRQTAAPKSGGVPHKGTSALKTPLSRQSAAVQTSTQYAKTVAQRKAQRKMLQSTARQSKNAAHKLGGMTVQAGKAIGRAATSAVSSIATLGGGAVVLVLLLTVILVAAIVASPFGILLSGESQEPGTVPISAAVAQVNYDFDAELQALQTAADYDTITVTGQAADWVEVLAVFAVKVAGADVDAEDVATIDADRIERLKAVFWDMTTIEHEVEVIHHPGTENEEGWTERNLYITISAKTAEDMKTVYHFNGNQIAALEELLAQRDLLLELIEDTYAISTDTAKLLRDLPEDLSPEREAVVRTACSLVGKVNYFWGGKSGAIGWDSRWGTLMQVTAVGSPTTGTYRPYGLDCSGFVDWVFNNATGYFVGHGGGAIMQHSYCTNISWADAQPGDLVFYPGDSHVGIVGGWDEDGNLLIIHCSSGYNNVVITGKEGFTAIARPNYYTS